MEHWKHYPGRQDALVQVAKVAWLWEEANVLFLQRQESSEVAVPECAAIGVVLAGVTLLVLQCLWQTIWAA